MPTYREYLDGRGLSLATANSYLVDLGLFAAWYKGATGERLGLVFTPTDVREYRARLVAVERAAPGTINRKLAALRSYGNYLVSIGEVETNPAAAARGVKEQPRAPKWLDGKEQGRLMREAERAQQAAQTFTDKWQAARNVALVALVLHTGLRVAELAALDVADYVTAERSGELLVRDGKGHKARRLPLNLTARRALAAWRAARPVNDAPQLFTGRGGGRLTPRGIQKVIAELGRRAGVTVTPHRLRHTYAKNLVNTGASLDKVGALLGHSNLSTTAIYTTPGARDLAAAVAALED